MKWRITRVSLSTQRDVFYPIHVEGRNENFHDGHPMRRISWAIPSESLTNENYDLSGATVEAGAERYVP